MILPDSPERALVDTSVWISGELRREIDRERLPEEALVCVVTIAELQAGVIAAGTNMSRSRRLNTLQLALEPRFYPLMFVPLRCGPSSGCGCEILAAG